jgi:hypothetical protein
MSFFVPLCLCGSNFQPRRHEGTKNLKTMPYTAGFKFKSVDWIGPNVIRVDVDRGAYGDYRWQLYAGRTLIGVSPTSRSRIDGAINFGGAAAPLSVIAVDPIDALNDYGHLLHRKPWNAYRVTWPAVADADCKNYQIVAGRDPGDDYDLTNVIANVPHVAGLASYSFELPPFPDRGDWSIAVIAKDNALADGNSGTPREVIVPALVYPPDFVLTESGSRFETTLDAGVLTVSFTQGTPGNFASLITPYP